MQVQCTVRSSLLGVSSVLPHVFALILTMSVSTSLWAQSGPLPTWLLMLAPGHGRGPGDNVDNEIRSPQQVSKAFARAEAGSAHDQFLIGYSYAKGLSQPRDYSKALVWYEKAANRGDTAAITELGRMYAQGTGVAQNYDKALQWFRRAAEGGPLAAAATRQSLRSTRRTQEV